MKPEDIERLFYPVIDPTSQEELKKRGWRRMNAVPGAALVRQCSLRTKPKNGRRREVILVRRETSPEDVGGMFVAQGILTASGGKTSHAAVVARGWGKCAWWAAGLDIDYPRRKCA